MKEITWTYDARETIRGFPKGVREMIGSQLTLVQLGQVPTVYRPMPSVGAGVIEIKVSSDTEYRVLYVTKFGDSIIVFQAFTKNQQKTPQKELAKAQKRYSELKKAHEAAKRKERK